MHRRHLLDIMREKENKKDSGKEGDENYSDVVPNKAEIVQGRKECVM